MAVHRHPSISTNYAAKGVVYKAVNSLGEVCYYVGTGKSQGIPLRMPPGGTIVIKEASSKEAEEFLMSNANVTGSGGKD